MKGDYYGKNTVCENYTKNIIALCYILDSFEEFSERLKNAIPTKYNRNFISDLYYISMGKINFSLKTRRFYKENKTVIDTINKYSNLLLYTNFSYDGQDYLENEESLRFFHKYIMEHRGDLETILRVLNKIEQLKIDEIKLDKHMDFSKEEYELHYWKSENYRYVLLNNLVLVPSGETDLIRYKSTNSDYKIVASRGACKSSYLDAQMASQITLNSLIFNPDKLPNDASVDEIYKTVFGLKKQNKGKYTEISHLDVGKLSNEPFEDDNIMDFEDPIEYTGKVKQLRKRRKHI